MGRDTITVITPCHPQRAMPSGTLHRAINSVRGQLLPPESMIVEMDLCGAGAAVTRDRALRRVTTDWVAPLDSDDWFKPNHLSALLTHARETGADFVYSWYELVSEHPDGTAKFWGDVDPVMPPTHFANDFDPSSPVETTITVLMRTELALQVGYAALNRGEANSGEDYGMVLGMVRMGGTVSHLKQRTWFWAHRFDGERRLLNTGGMAGRGDAR